MLAKSGAKHCTIVDAGCGQGGQACKIRDCMRGLNMSCRMVGIDETFAPPCRVQRAASRLYAPLRRADVAFWWPRPFRCNGTARKMDSLPLLRSLSKPRHALCHDGRTPFDEYHHCAIQNADVGPVADAVILSYVTNTCVPDFGAVFAAAAAMCAPGGVVIASCFGTDYDDVRVLGAAEAAEHAARCAGTADCRHGAAV